ncbi:MAG: TetR/AcrR family transcriptional regulator [Deltaproteobacteria bacterium]|nr:TetR/AcrR family transcriptional regulator [Deltaproteobacteria bacterium]
MSSKRGRPREYDPDRALDAAIALFLARGYAATTLDALSEATGMQRPSLYAAFGDKRTIFASVVRRFQQRMSATLEEALGQDHLDEALSALLVKVTDIYSPRDGLACGCLVFGVAAVEAVECEVMRATVEGAINALDERIRSRLARAVEDAELPPQCDVQTLARMVGAAMHSISLRARSGASRRSLLAFARKAVAMVLAGARAL